MSRPLPHDRRPFSAAFTMLELLAALAIGAAMLVVAVLVFQNLSAGSRPEGTYVRLDLGTSVLSNFYGLNQTSIDAWVAPNYGRRAQADLLRDKFWADVEKASAVYCLGRDAGVLNTIHPTTITLSSSLQGQEVDLPDKDTDVTGTSFRKLLEACLPAAVGVFSPYRGACTSKNLSIFILQPSEDAGVLSVLSVYDIDLISTETQQGIAGTYVSGRRYEGGVLTDFYDIFFPAGTGTLSFNPLAVAFERSVRLSKVETTSIDRLKVAAGQPFYFIWWPDPAAPELEGLTTTTYPDTDPRASYPNMGGRTSLFFAVPMFPAL